MQKKTAVSVKLFYASLLTLILSLVFNFILPDTLENHPKGFQTPLLAFQLAEESSDLDFLRSNPAMINSMWWLHIVDMFFPIAYTCLFVLEALQLAHKRKWLQKAAKFMWIIIAFDWMENFLMLATIVSLSDASEVGLLLIYLRIFTVLKWSAIAFTSLVLSFAWMISKSYLSGIIASCVWVLWTMSLTADNPAFWAENMLRALGFLLALRIVYNVYTYLFSHLKAFTNKP